MLGAPSNHRAGGRLSVPEPSIANSRARRRRSASLAAGEAPLESGVPFALLVSFTLLTFLNLPNRLAAIGAIRPTVVFVVLLTLCVFGNWENVKTRLMTRESKMLLAIIVYIIASLPFVEWPGSVITKNFELFIRAAVFFLFVVAFVDSVNRLRVLLWEN